MDTENESAELFLEDVDLDDEIFAEFDDEPSDFEAFFGEYGDDDDDGDEAAEEAEFIGPLLGAVAGPALGALAGPLVNTIGGLFGAGRGPKRYNPAAGGISVGPGISRAILNTPRGSATLRLPSAVVPRAEFLRVTGALRTAINRNTGRINTTQRDLDVVRRQTAAATAAVTAVRNDLTKYKKAAARLRRRDRRAWAAAIAKLRAEQRSQATMNMIMSMLMQQQIQDSIEDHTHDDSTGNPTTGANDTGDRDNTFLFLLPAMMQPGGSSGDSMMWMMMALALRD